MTWQGYAQLGLYFVVLLALVKPLGGYMARVYGGERLLLERVLGPVERLMYRAAGVPADDEAREMSWTAYAGAMLLFHVVGVFAVYLIQRVQGLAPLNPQGLPAPSPDLSWNTAVSFATNTNWQSYGGETTLSYLTQMLGLTVQNFVSAAAGIAILIALVRGIVRKTGDRNRKLLGRFRPDDALRASAALARLSRCFWSRRVSSRRSARTAPSRSFSR